MTLSIEKRLPSHIRLKNPDNTITDGALNFFCQQKLQWALREKIRTLVDPNYKPIYSTSNGFNTKELNQIIETVSDIYG